MDLHDSKLEMGVTLTIFLMLGALFLGFRAMKHKDYVDKEISYEMPRPNTFAPGEYDLSNRQIERKYINPFEKMEEINKHSAQKGKSIGAVVKTSAKKSNPQKVQGSKKRKPQFKFDVVERSKNGLSASTDTERSGSRASPLSNQNVAQEPGRVNDLENPNRNEDIRSTEQWRSLLQGQPTIENMRKLMLAFSKKLADSATFYEVTLDLIKSQKVETQIVGLYGLHGFPSSKSFLSIAQHFDLFQNKSRKYADEILMSYNQPQLLKFLNEVLLSKDETSVLKAGEVINVGLQKFKAGEGLGDGNKHRGDIKIKSAIPYTILIPTLQQLISMPQGPVSQIANTLLVEIQALNPSDKT